MSFTEEFLDACVEAVAGLDRDAIDAVAGVLAATKADGGRMFLCGSGGGAGHASHAACDFRKLAGIECYSVSDNVSELTARVNDDGWDTAYSNWLQVSSIRQGDCLFVFSVGGGDAARNVSANLVNAMHLARDRGASIVGIVGRDGGELARTADACILVPTIVDSWTTPITEGFQALLWHLLVTHPALDPNTPKWESMSA